MYYPSVKKTCPVCKETFKALRCRTRIGKQKYCSNKCRFIGMKGSNNPNWRNVLARKGGSYLHMFLPTHPAASKKDKLVPFHRIIAETMLSRFLTHEEQIHHLDFNPFNNCPTNLYLFPSNSAHISYHNSVRNGKGNKITKSNLPMVCSIKN